MRAWLSGLLVCSGLVAAGAALSSNSGAEPSRTALHAATPQPQESRSRIFLTAAQVSQALARGEIDRPIKSIINVPQALRYGQFVWRENGVPDGPVWIRVDLDRQLMSVFRSGHEIGTAVILYGAYDKETPLGRFPILSKDKDHHSSTYDAPMPYTLRLTPDGVSIHGSNVRWGYGTHGCIGVPLEFAKRLFNATHRGDDVLIVSKSHEHRDSPTPA
jgi:lipoprotein-anchoring transpeptidase ErfK/SrfK